MTVLLCVGEGLGNVIQVLPLAKMLSENKIKVFILNLSNCNNATVEFLFKNYAKVCHDLDIHKYHGRIELATTKANLRTYDRIQIPLLNDQVKQHIYRLGVNEIETYLEAGKELGLILSDYNVEIPVEISNHYDFVIHNGCSLQNPGQWERKKYPFMPQLVIRLQEAGYSVAIIGAPHEYVGYGSNLTGLPIQTTASIIKGCKCFISNDTGTYHLAAALRKTGIALFTATSIEKNYHKEFHKTIKIVTAGLSCQPCQYKEEWNRCSIYTHNKWGCRNIPLDTIIKEIKNVKTIF